MSFFGLKKGQDLENQAAHPHQDIPRGNPPPPPPQRELGLVTALVLQNILPYDDVRLKQKCKDEILKKHRNNTYKNNPKILDQILSTRENGSSLASTIATDGNGLNYYTKRLECLHDSSQTFKLVEPHIARLPRTRSKNRGVEVLGTKCDEVCHRALQDLDPVFNISLPCQNSLSRPLFISFRKRNFCFSFYLALGFYIGFLANTILKICNIVYTINQYIALPDPHPQIRGRQSPTKMFLPFGPQFGLKINWGTGPSGPSPRSATVL